MRKQTSKTQKKVNYYAKQLVKRRTRHEKLVLQELTKRKVDFTFQKTVFEMKIGYILDFYFKNKFSKRYCIEIDGDTHNSESAKKYDLKRAQWLLERRRIQTIRFTNKEVETNLNGVIEKIMSLDPKIKETPDGTWYVRLPK